MEILLSDGLRVRHIPITPLRKKVFLYSVSGFVLLTFSAIGGFIWSQSQLDSTRSRLTELENRYEAERRNSARISEEVGVVASRADDIGRAVGMLHLAFGALFAPEAIEIQEKQNPEMAAFRRHLTSIQDRFTNLKGNLERMQNSLAHGSKGGLSGNRERASNISAVKSDLEKLFASMQGWEEDSSFPGGKSYNNAKHQVNTMLTALGTLEGDILKAVSRSDEEIFGGAPSDVCVSDPDRTMIRLLNDQKAMMNDYIAFSNLMFETMRQSLERSGVEEKRIFPNGIRDEINQTQQALNNANASIDRIMEYFDKLPVGAPVDQYFLTSGFGMRKNPMGRGTEMHEGVDFAAPRGTISYSTAGGKVIQAGPRSGYGYSVEIDHGNGLRTLYGHLSKVEATEGKMVKRGEVVGLVGSTGRSTGPHLHYEVRLDNQLKNPTSFLRAATLSTTCK